MRISDWSSDVGSSDLDLMMAFPALLLAIALAAIFAPSLWIVAMVIALVNWVQIARVIYTATTALTEREYIEAARALGDNWPREIGRATCRDSVCQYELIAVVAVSLKKHNKKQ